MAGAIVKKNKLLTGKEMEKIGMDSSIRYATWYNFKKDLEKQLHCRLLNRDWLDVKPGAPLPWNDSHMKASLSAVVRSRSAVDHTRKERLR